MGQIDPTFGLGTLKTRRQFLQVGYSGLLGMGLPGFLQRGEPQRRRVNGWGGRGR